MDSYPLRKPQLRHSHAPFRSSSRAGYSHSRSIYRKGWGRASRTKTVWRRLSSLSSLGSSKGSSLSKWTVSVSLCGSLCLFCWFIVSASVVCWQLCVHTCVPYVSIQSSYRAHTLPHVNVCPHDPSLLRMHAPRSRAPDSLLGRVAVVSGLAVAPLPTA
jgi:hypothetical protein